MKTKSSNKGLAVATALFVGGITAHALLTGAEYAQAEAAETTIEIKVNKTIQEGQKEIVATIKEATKIEGWFYNKELGASQYYDHEGQYYTGLQLMDKEEGEKKAHYSYFDVKTGAMATGLTKDEKSGDYYYFDSKGWMKTGWVSIKNKTEGSYQAYFDKKGKMLVDTKLTTDDNVYTFNSKGKLVKTEKVEKKTAVSNAEVSTNTDTSGWSSGVASAYGGSSDPGCGSTTANGSRVTESSMGVAIPMAWGRSDLLGHKVLISYGGKTVTATINDVGGMGGGSRSLDLQPGVFKAFGYNTCNSWGLRTVSYKIL